MKKLFFVRYDGLWLGGRALVFADNAEQAIELVKNDADTCSFKDVSAEEIEADGVVYNDNGDY
jgi:hypothetical protein